MVNAFVFPLDIPVVINILYEMIKILHEKMLNAIYLYCFHNDIFAENNSLNGHSNRGTIQRTLNKWIEVRHISCQVKSSCYIIQQKLVFFYHVNFPFFRESPSFNLLNLKT